jgi:uncharacterized protein YjbI with pentapeptide repeats
MPMDMSLHDIVVAHQRWLNSAGQDGKRANFRGVDLSGQIFAGFVLTQASFRNANLNGTRFTECVLDEADFAEATGVGAEFYACQMKSTNFARANMPNTKFGHCHMQKSVFLQARLDSAQFEDSRLQESNFREAILPNLRMLRVEWRKSTLRSMSATHGNFQQVRFDGVDGKEANFNHARFDTVAWHGAYLRDASFQHALMEESDLTTAEEVDAVSVSATEKTQAAQRLEEMRALERQRGMVLELQHALTLREERLNKTQKAFESFRQHVALEEAGIRQRASTLRLIAAGWCMITAMILTIVFDQVRRLGLENIRLMELTLLLLGVLFVLLLHVSSTVLSYKISKQLWRLIDEKERMDDDFED